MEIHPEDAHSIGISDGDMVRVTSRRGYLELPVLVTERVDPKSCFIPFHYREAAANVLTINAVDPVAKIPEYKVCAAKVEKL